jgi:Tfp pilus assembly protein PilV
VRYRRETGARRRCAGGRRDGSFVIEAVISVVILATASYGLVRLARYSAELTRYADGQLAATLVGQNALDRLQRVETDQLQAAAADIERVLQTESGCDVSIGISPFELLDRDGFHLTVEVTVDTQVAVSMHDWRIENGGGPSAEVNETAANKLSENRDQEASDDEE